MTHWIFTEEHELFRRTVRKFVEKEVKPYVNDWEKEGGIPRSLFKRIGDLSYLGIKVPKKYGGLGLDYITEAVFLEELTKCGSGGVGAAIGGSIGIAMTPILNFGNDYQKTKYVQPTIAGDMVGALGITEPNAGSDVSSLRTTATKKDGYYELNGSKTFITNGINADYVVVAAKTRNEPLHKNISLFIVETGWDGFEVGKPLQKLGWRSSDTGELFFENVAIPEENLIGNENDGFYYIMKNFQWERIILSLACVAHAEMALEASMKYSSERIQFNQPISAFQVIQHKMVDMAVDIEKAKHMTYRALYLFNEGKDITTEATFAKVYAGEMVNRVCDEALQIFGGAGYMMEYDVQRYWRDARVQSIGGGTTQIMNEILSKQLRIVD
ncbi:acyl-CoA dehydrogenase family protein [Cytobacillus sp. IB215665]|uniref:acyl-CoA dehydrogenase family protein n=1 Tax=Cytobacillus sp. IB215665 TaxID=3097357 RepID=UPI002A0AB1B7|nr:acyl-CoA dehydrogenase family protein [Cytobacillus sp. IB215665]MDX8364475.1 acyl-CoA dehydrogenase family protein [Cytobacillus sp. IB215665]